MTLYPNARGRQSFVKTNLKKKHRSLTSRNKKSHAHKCTNKHKKKGKLYFDNEHARRTIMSSSDALYGQPCVVDAIYVRIHTFCLL